MRLQLFHDLSLARDHAELERRLLDVAHEIGFGLVSGMFVREVPGGSADVVPLGNRPEAFLESSTNKDDSARDPLLNRLKALSVPLIYDQGLYVAEGAADLWELQAQFGYRTGIAVALHLPGQRHLILGLNREEPLPKADDKLVRMLSELQLMIVHAQQPVLNLFNSNSQIHLSPREIQILLLILEGKSNKVIAKELGCEVVNVTFHLQKSSKKLGVNTRYLAASKARALGLI